MYWMHSCWNAKYEKRLKQDQYVCFKCRCVKNVSRKKKQPKLFYFLADGVPYAYKKTYPDKIPNGIPKCSECAQAMEWVGPHFKAPKQRRKREWQRLAGSHLALRSPAEAATTPQLRQ